MLAFNECHAEEVWGAGAGIISQRSRLAHPGLADQRVLLRQCHHRVGAHAHANAHAHSSRRAPHARRTVVIRIALTALTDLQEYQILGSNARHFRTRLFPGTPHSNRTERCAGLWFITRFGRLGLPAPWGHDRAYSPRGATILASFGAPRGTPRGTRRGNKAPRVFCVFLFHAPPWLPQSRPVKSRAGQTKRRRRAHACV